MRVITYTTPEERQLLLQDAETQGETMLHDDFLEVDEQGRVKVGQLTVDVQAPEPPNPGRARRKALQEKLHTQNLTLAELQEMLSLERKRSMI